MITNRASDDTYYNYTDLNRVETKVSELAPLFSAQGYIVNITAKTDWVAGDIPPPDDKKRYIDNVRKCVTQLRQESIAKVPYTLDDLTSTGANEIEKALVEVEAMYYSMLPGIRRCGTFNCGG